MSLSQDVLAFLNHLDNNGDIFELDFLRGAYDTIRDTDPSERLENPKMQAIMQHAMAQVVESRMSPVTDSRAHLESFLEAIRDITGADPLNAYFTVLALSQVPGYVERWRSLRRLHLHSAPERRVATYFAQATKAYLFGLFDAVAILSRSVIQFSLEERLSPWMPELQLIKRARKDYLCRLVELAYAKGLLNVALKRAAHDVRDWGNDASHEKPCDDPARALEAIKSTRRVLVGLYTGIKTA